MAKKSTPVAPAATPVAEPVAPAANPMAAMVAAVTAPAAPAVNAHAVMLAKAQANGMQATVAGATVTAAANVAARAANLGKLPAHIATGTYVLAKVPKVRVAYTSACLAALQQVGGIGHVATGAQWAQFTTGDFVGYAVKSGWLAKA